MKRFVFLAVVCLACLNTPVRADFENGDFSSGKNQWRGDGRVEKVEDANVLVVSLSKNNFSEAIQSFKVADTVKKIKITVQVKASPDYLLNGKSRNISEVDFKGGAIWSALVHPKADFQIRVKGEMYHYKLATISSGKWTTVKLEVGDLKDIRNIELALVFAPGDGSIMAKAVTVEEVK